MIRKRDTWPLSLSLLSLLVLDVFDSFLNLNRKPSIDCSDTRAKFEPMLPARFIPQKYWKFEQSTRIPRLRPQRSPPFNLHFSSGLFYARIHGQSWGGGNSMAHLMATQSVLDLGANGWRRRKRRGFPLPPSFARLPDPRAHQRASPPPRIAKDFIVMNLIFVQTASPPDHSTSRAEPSRADSAHREGEYLEGWGWRTLEWRAVSRPVTRNPIKLGDANEI